MRRVATGHDENGRSIVVSDGPIPRSREFTSLPGWVSRLPWATEAGQQVSRTGEDTPLRRSPACSRRPAARGSSS
ncbi:hypothetical protein [Streptomyces sp. NPDC093591]|uniref:hypothetical protein n=1 Tax=Streptomyces sp. NPDC093591 TaxID=3366044 RepID=UPI0038199BF2